MVTKEIIECPTRLGPAGYGVMDGKIAILWLPGMAANALRRNMTAWAGRSVKPVKSRSGLAERIAAYFDGERVEFPDPVDLSAMTEFQRSVLTLLREKAPWGKTLTYSGLAQLCGKPGSGRAVGGVMAKNPVPLIIPCHRVIRAGGRLGGFSGPGKASLKRIMLRLEGAGVI